MGISVSREVAVSLSFLLFGAGVFYSIYSIDVVEGVNAVYTNTLIIPNFVSAVLFDWRGFDTLGECLILITSVLVTGVDLERDSLTGISLKRCMVMRIVKMLI